MGFDRQYAGGLLLRLLLTLLALMILAQALVLPGLFAVKTIAALAAAGAGWGLWRHIRRTNLEVARFVEAVQFGDLQARFARPAAGSGFDTLGETLDRGIKALRDDRMKLGDSARFHEALIEDAPVAMLTLGAAGAVEPANKAARKLLSRHRGVRPADFEVYGHPLVEAITALAAGRSTTLVLNLDIGPQRAIVRAGELTRPDGTTRVIAIQVIQHSLNAVELAAQSDLIRVLTHEIMNSLTPITSLAQSAAALMAAVDRGDDPDVADARTAIETLARRADGVMHFVETYREITRPPQVDRRAIPARGFADELARLFGAEERWRGVVLAVTVDPDGHVIDADPDLLAQVAINLLRNAAEAAQAHADRPAVSLTVTALSSGRTHIEVADNGAGVPVDIAGDIFLPFFTTKRTGTGVGLSFARQVALAHDGSIEVAAAEGGGARFRLVL